MLALLKAIATGGNRTEPLARHLANAQTQTEAPAACARLQQEILRLLGRALVIRHVDAGSCNACELEIHALGNPYYNIEGTGIRFAASPRHADCLLVTGLVTRNMHQALRRAYEAMPAPKLVIASGDCAHCPGGSQGIFGQGYALSGAVSNVIPVDAIIPGCPPSPVVLLQGLLAVLGRTTRAKAE